MVPRKAPPKQAPARKAPVKKTPCPKITHLEHAILNRMLEIDGVVHLRDEIEIHIPTGTTTEVAKYFSSLAESFPNAEVTTEECYDSEWGGYNGDRSVMTIYRLPDEKESKRLAKALDKRVAIDRWNTEQKRLAKEARNAKEYEEYQRLKQKYEE